MMSLIQELLPHVAALNNLSLALQQPAPDPADAPSTVSPHCCWVESEHPYPAAAVRQQRCGGASLSGHCRSHRLSARPGRSPARLTRQSLAANQLVSNS